MTDHDDDPLIGSAEVRRLLGGCHQITLYRKIKEDPRFQSPCAAWSAQGWPGA